MPAPLNPHGSYQGSDHSEVRVRYGNRQALYPQCEHHDFCANENAELAGVANYLAAEVVKATGLALPVKDASGASGKNGIQLVLTGQDAALGDEGYELTLEKDRVIITANQSWPGYFMACRRYIDLIST